MPEDATLDRLLAIVDRRAMIGTLARGAMVCVPGVRVLFPREAASRTRTSRRSSLRSVASSRRWRGSESHSPARRSLAWMPRQP